MKMQRVLTLLALATAILIPTAASEAMNLNVACPWNDKCSPPQTPYLAFYSPQAADMLFDPAALPPGQSSLEFLCQAGVRSVGMTWTLHRNMVDKPFQNGKAEALPANRFRIRIVPDGLPPGFYDLKVVLDSGMESTDPKDKRPIRGVCVFGWRRRNWPFRIRGPRISRPSGRGPKGSWQRSRSTFAARRRWRRSIAPRSTPTT